MARKPVTTYAGGKGPRQMIWEAIRALTAARVECWDEGVVWHNLPRAARATVSAATIRDYRRDLCAAGIVAVVTPASPRTSGTYRLVKDEGIEAPRVRRDGSRVTQGLAQEQMWRTLRMLAGDTNARELAAHAGTPAVPVAELAAKDYLLTLAKAGYLLTTKEGKGLGYGRGGVQARYRLKPTRNTGPRPPMICRTRVVYDPNEDKIVWQPCVTEEDAVYGK